MWHKSSDIFTKQTVQHCILVCVLKKAPRHLINSSHLRCDAYLKEHLLKKLDTTMKYFLLISSIILWKILQEETAASFDCHHLWLLALFNCISRVSSLNLDLTKSGNLKRFASSSPQMFIWNRNRVVKEFRIWISAVLWPRALRARLSTFSFQMRHSFEGGVYSGVALIRENMTRVSWHAKPRVSQIWRYVYIQWVELRQTR